MSNSNHPHEVLARPTVLVSGDVERVIGNFRITSGGAKSFRMDIYVGATAGGTVILQDSAAFNLWNTVKTATLPVVTATAVSGIASNILTATGHGLASGAPVHVAASVLPTGLVADKIYYALVLSANTLSLSQEPGGEALPVSGGTSVTVAGVASVSLKLLAEVAADQTLLPLRGEGRIVGTFATGNAAVLSVKVCQEN